MMELHPKLSIGNALEHGANEGQTSVEIALVERKAYVQPILSVHGRFERVTLQTSGATVPPPATDGPDQTG